MSLDFILTLYVAIIDIPFTMSMEEDFINRIEELSHERERMIYKGVL